MADFIKFGLGDELFSVISITRANDVVEKMRKIHKSSPVATAAMGRLMIGAKLMSLFLKEKGSRLSLSISSDGDIKKLIAFADYDSHLKVSADNVNVENYINEEGKLDVARAIGKGTLSVISDGENSKPFTGSIELVSSEIAEDIASYYAVSEQLASVVNLGVFVDADNTVLSAGGYILQTLPFISEEKIEYLEKSIAKSKAISELMASELSLEQIIDEIFPNIEKKILAKGNYDYNCDCSYERSKRAVSTLKKEEIEEIKREVGFLNVHCDYCGKDYKFW